MQAITGILLEYFAEFKNAADMVCLGRCVCCACVQYLVQAEQYWRCRNTSDLPSNFSVFNISLASASMSLSSHHMLGSLAI